MEKIRGQLCQGNQDKTPLMQLRMRDGEASIFYDLGSVEEYVDIDKPRSHRKAPFPPHLLLDTLQKAMEVRGQKGGSGLCHAIDEPILISVAYGFCFIEGRNGLYMGVIGSVYPLKGTPTIIRLIAEVRA